MQRYVDRNQFRQAWLADKRLTPVYPLIFPAQGTQTIVDPGDRGVLPVFSYHLFALAPTFILCSSLYFWSYSQTRFLSMLNSRAALWMLWSFLCSQSTTKVLNSTVYELRR